MLGCFWYSCYVLKISSTPLLCILALLWAACGPLTPVSGQEFRLKSSDAELRVTASGGIILGKRQVGSVDKEGKVTTSTKGMMAWVSPTEIRLKGGKVLAVKIDKEGAMYLPQAPQEAAGLTIEPRRIRKDGTVVASNSATTGPQIAGSKSERSRALALFLLLSLRNDLWPSRPDIEE